MVIDLNADLDVDVDGDESFIVYLVVDLCMFDLFIMLEMFVVA